MDERARLGAVRIGDDNLGARALRHGGFRRLVNVAVGVAGDGDRLFPSGNKRLDTADEDRRAEHGAVQNRADGAVGTFPHFLEIIFLDALRVRSDGRALDRDAVLFRRVGAVNRHLITRFVAVRQTEIVILRL